ncbi:hypothetical protein PAXRUDRAFT_436288 [Paxillus rubicundulus Ve08.2h10]|uniref:Uncharacterized protein n=1 Tax=Paxillus rubicundulus Ve08.2h10 TaxID=930991 RepID=A0A0D0CYQ5_9AGAM|nr:hypothetical protein PAXRUDRAFT_436288 [Paxillus rubicundulus Ve08.2h10]
MKTFLTLLAAIASLSAYTLVGVHALKCAICPSSLRGILEGTKCASHTSEVNTYCVYNRNIDPLIAKSCRYGPNGSLLTQFSDPSCPTKVAMTSTDCPTC